MTVNLGVIMDPIEGINVFKDSTFAMLLEAQKRGYKIYYAEVTDLFLADKDIMAYVSEISVQDDKSRWFEKHSSTLKNLGELDVLLMRKDPPFDMEYIYATFLLDRLHDAGTIVVNHPASLRNANEKLFATNFSNCIPPFVITKNKRVINDFINNNSDVVAKPLDAMAGDSIFRIQHNDTNRNVIIETITKQEQRTVMVQKFIKEYARGDKRILLIDGEPMPYSLVRIPAAGELRANLAKGGKAEGAVLTDRDRWICDQIKPTLNEMKLSFVGIDVIGDYLTEINVTSPTGIRELDKMYDLNICATLFNSIETQLNRVQ